MLGDEAVDGRAAFVEDFGGLRNVAPAVAKGLQQAVAFDALSVVADAGHALLHVDDEVVQDLPANDFAQRVAHGALKQGFDLPKVF